MPAEHTAEATAVRRACMAYEMSRAACVQCSAACCLCIVCGYLWLMKRAKRVRDVHWGNVPLHPS